MGTLLRQMKDLGMSPLKLANQDCGGPTLAQTAGAAANGMVCPNYEQSGAEFREKYIRRFGETPGIAADLGYDSLKMVAESLRKSDLTSKGISAQLAAIKNFPGASGSITLDEHHERVERPVNLFQVMDGVVTAIAR